MGAYRMSGGGPWGGGPWGGGPRGGNGQGPRGRPPKPPDFEELLRRGQDGIRRLVPGGVGGGKGALVVVLALVLLWLASGVYRVQPDEQGVVLRFGRYEYTSQPGLHMRWPWPVETVETPPVTHVNQLEIGFRSAPGLGATRASGREIDAEAHMLTGDENIVDINFTVQWVINDARKYLFDIRDPDRTVKAAAESAMREIVGETPIAAALAEGKAKIMTDTKALLQKILDSYGAGITVTDVFLQKVDPPAEVIDAFNDVQRARADQERKRNEAEAYANSILPAARGQAVKIVQESEAYKQQVVAEAQGQAQRFLSVYEAYRKAADVTRQRLYIETMQDILAHADKVIIDRGSGGPGVVPYLPLPGLAAEARPPTPAPGAGAPDGAASGPGLFNPGARP